MPADFTFWSQMKVNLRRYTKDKISPAWQPKRIYNAFLYHDFSNIVTLFIGKFKNIPKLIVSLRFFPALKPTINKMSHIMILVISCK